MGSKLVGPILLCFAGARLQHVLFLEHLFHSIKREVLLESEQFEGPMIGWKAKWLE